MHVVDEPLRRVTGVHAYGEESEDWQRMFRRFKKKHPGSSVRLFFVASADATSAPPLHFTRRIRSEKSVVFDVSEKPRSADELGDKV